MRSDVSEIAGSVFGKLTAVRPLRRNNRIYWHCECVCGRSKAVRGDALISGKTANCGCDTSQLISEANSLPAGDAHINLALHFYKKSARDRRLEFSLTRDEFLTLASADCSYCGVAATEESSPYARDNLTSLHPINGIARIDSKIGYTLDNSASCCGRCNQIKMDMDVGEFVAHVHKIVDYYKKIGLGGYVVGRSVEKATKNFKGVER